jgi:hypothetical protein
VVPSSSAVNRLRARPDWLPRPAGGAGPGGWRAGIMALGRRLAPLAWQRRDVGPSLSPNAGLLKCFLTVQAFTVEAYRDDASPATAAAPCAETR